MTRSKPGRDTGGAVAVMLRETGNPEGVGVVDFDQLYESNWWPMLRLAQGLVDDVASAEDVVQEAFAQLYTKIPSLRDPQVAAGYLRRSVVNGARSALRRRRTVRAYEPDRTESAPGADHRALARSSAQEVRRTLTSLPPRQREVLTLRFLAGLTDEEIADALGTSASNVRSAASRGLASLRADTGGVR